MQVAGIEHLERIKWATGKRVDGTFEIWGLFPDKQSAEWSAQDWSVEAVPIESLESAYILEQKRRSYGEQITSPSLFLTETKAAG